MAELTTKEKKFGWLTLLWLIVTFCIHIPLWLLLIGYILYIVGAGVAGWVLFVLYAFSMLFTNIVAKIIEKISKSIAEEKKEREEHEREENRFINATPINRR